MGTEITGGLDPDEFFKNTMKMAGEDAVEHHAQQLAEIARENGMASVDDIEVDLEVIGDPGGDIPIDEASIRARANEILRGE